MFTTAKNIVSRAWRNPFVLLTATTLLLGAVEISRLLPMDAAFSPSVSWIDFFEMPVVKFYLVLALAGVEAAQRIGLLPYIFFLLTLGVLSSCDHAALRSRPLWIFKETIAELQIAMFIFFLYRIGIITSSLSIITILAFPLLYLALLTLLQKTKTASSHPTPYGA
ncbi:MAG: hypothetical protein WAP52_00670 [Candidatus Sungiibacteriota bacterium]